MIGENDTVSVFCGTFSSRIEFDLKKTPFATYEINSDRSDMCFGESIIGQSHQQWALTDSTVAQQ